MGENCFSRELRLLTPAHFENVFNQATAAVSPHLTLLARNNQTSHPRLGITISKKKVRKACQRNRVKRIIRESFRLKAESLPHIDIIAIGKSGADDLSNEELFKVLDKLWKKLAHRCSSLPSA